MSTAGGVFKAFDHGAATDSATIQIFTKNNTRWQAKPRTDSDVERFREAQRVTGIKPVIAHTSYLINLAGPKEDLHAKSMAAMRDEIERAELLAIPDLVLHPGSPLHESKEYGMARIAESLNRLIEQTRDSEVRIALELTAGQGNHLGYRFEQIAELIDQVENKERVSCCLDTCHIFAAGYDLRTESSYEATIHQFAKTIGLEYLKVIHLNDSKEELDSRKDRHTYLGDGCIGSTAFRCIMQDRRLGRIPKLLETPKGKNGHAADIRNLRMLRRFHEQCSR
jgi:deoxyribonuclease-4